MDDSPRAQAPPAAQNLGARPRFGVVLITAAALFAGLLLSCGDKPKSPNCKTDKDCKSPLVCAANKCVQCTEDSQCAKGQRCSANACVAKAECAKDDQCPAGKVCQAGQC